MTDQITDRTMVVVSRLGDFWVNKQRADNIIEVKQKDPSGSIELDGNLIACSSIEGVVSAEQYQIINNRRRGAWQCKYRWWHEKFQQCAHQSFNPKG